MAGRIRSQAPRTESLPLLVLTPEMSAELAQRVYAAVLREDDSFRSDRPLLAELANAREELVTHASFEHSPRLDHFFLDGTTIMVWLQAASAFEVSKLLPRFI